MRGSARRPNRFLSKGAIAQVERSMPQVTVRNADEYLSFLGIEREIV